MGLLTGPEFVPHLCYSTFVKLAKTKFIAEILNSPFIEKNIIGEKFLRKIGTIINYKDGKVEDV